MISKDHSYEQLGSIPEMEIWFDKHTLINVICYISRQRDKIFMIISTYAQMAFDRMQYPHWSQSPEDSRDGGITPEHKNAICYEPMVNIMQMKKKSKHFHGD